MPPRWLHILVGRQRQINGRYQALASHYNFEPLFCMVARGREASRRGTCAVLAAGMVHAGAGGQGPGRAQRPPADVLRRSGATQAGQSETIGQRFQRDSDKAMSLPQRPFDPCFAQPAQVDKYQTIRFDNNYSVPRAWAFRNVTVKAYVEHIEIVAGRPASPAIHAVMGKGSSSRPAPLPDQPGPEAGGLDHANVYRHWTLPPAFSELRRTLEVATVPRPGTAIHPRAAMPGPQSVSNGPSSPGRGRSAVANASSSASTGAAISGHGLQTSPPIKRCVPSLIAMHVPCRA